MAKFARDIMFKVHEVTKGLEVTLGPDTGDLSIRGGMHSGPVTAGKFTPALLHAGIMEPAPASPLVLL